MMHPCALAARHLPVDDLLVDDLLVDEQICLSTCGTTRRHVQIYRRCNWSCSSACRSCSRWRSSPLPPCLSLCMGRRDYLHAPPTHLPLRLTLEVHPQALAWVSFLPSETRPTAVVEIIIANRNGVINNCYQTWSRVLGVRYLRAEGALAGGCTGGATRRDNEAARHHKTLMCNVSVDVRQTVGAAMIAARETASGTPTRTT